MSNAQINNLVDLRNRHQISIQLGQQERLEDLYPVELKIGEKGWTIYVDDEYQDLSKESQLLGLFLTLRELEIYKDETDFLKWCSQNGTSPKNGILLNYYKELGKYIIEIEKKINTIDSCISPLEYELRTEVIDQLIAIN